MSESSETGQASIVFLGRESFRMQVGDAIPTAFREGPTEKIIERRNWERRNWERRKPRHGDDVAALAAARAGRKKLVVGVALATFACGIVVATTFHRMRSRAQAERLTAMERAQPPAVAPAPKPAAPVSPAVVAAPSAPPEPVVSPAPVASAPPAGDPPIEKRLTQPKARPAARIPAAHTARPRRTAAAAPAHAPAIQAATQPPAATPRPRKVWVDPFAE